MKGRRCGVTMKKVGECKLILDNFSKRRKKDAERGKEEFSFAGLQDR